MHTLARKAGRLTADLHLTFHSSNSNPPLSSPALQLTTPNPLHTSNHSESHRSSSQTSLPTHCFLSSRQRLETPGTQAREAEQDLSSSSSKSAVSPPALTDNLLGPHLTPCLHSQETEQILVEFPAFLPPVDTISLLPH